MSKVYRRKDSPVYWIAYRSGNKRIRESSGTKSKVLAENILRQRETEALLDPRNEHIKGNRNIEIFLGEYIEWIRINRRHHTLRSYRTVLGLFGAYLKNSARVVIMKDITPKLLEDYKRERLRVSKTNTVKNHVIVIKALFNKAVEWGYLTESPARWLKAVEITDAKAIRFLSEEEYRRFMEVCRGPKFNKFYPMFYTFVHTGMRSGELLSLEWRDIDLENGFIHVRSKEGFMPKGVDHKSGKAKERIIPVHEGVVKVIGSLPRKGHKVFDQHNRPRRILHRIAKEAGIKGLTRLHELRHSYASFLLSKGVDIYKIKELLGHSDIRDTMKYAHLPTVHMKEDVGLLRGLDNFNDDINARHYKEEI